MKKHSRTYAKKLFELSLENNRVNAERVNAVLTLLSKNKPKDSKDILKLYQVKIKQALRSETLKVQSAGNLELPVFSQIHSKLEEHYKRKLSVTMIPNAHLLAGIRIEVGDDVWDYSVAGRLDSLSKKFSH